MNATYTNKSVQKVYREVALCSVVPQRLAILHVTPRTINEAMFLGPLQPVEVILNLRGTVIRQPAHGIPLYLLAQCVMNVHNSSDHASSLQVLEVGVKLYVPLLSRLFHQPSVRQMRHLAG